EYTQMHISRKYWYVEGNKLLKAYKRQEGFLSSKSWRLTKPLRIVNQKRHQIKKRLKLSSLIEG
ncbi:hypothetical protein OSK45_28880, partial [Escherichia coli]|nr:hypothetical protein [Escherichia coli]